jgi:guanine deaminase
MAVTLARDGESLGPLDLFDLPEEAEEGWWREAVERWWCVGDDRNRTGMWVQGRRVR